MTYSYRLSDEAELDVEDSYLWYERKQEVLGESFLESLDHAREAIISNPHTYRVRYKKKVRAFVMNRFPFLILYIINGKSFDVLCAFNTNQHPRKWKKRV